MVILLLPDNIMACIWYIDLFYAGSFVPIVFSLEFCDGFRDAWCIEKNFPLEDEVFGCFQNLTFEFLGQVLWLFQN